MLAFRDNIFANPEGLIAYIAKHPERRPRAAGHEGRVLRRMGNAAGAAQRRHGDFAGAGRDCGEGGEGGVSVSGNPYGPAKTTGAGGIITLTKQDLGVLAGRR